MSLITQVLYALVFVTRYLDSLWEAPSRHLLPVWNFVLKNFYIISSLYIIFLMLKVYARTREREKAWRLGACCLAGSIVLAPIITAIAKYEPKKPDKPEPEFQFFAQMVWSFSIVLESVCVIPQLLLLRQTTVPTVIDSFYLLTLGSYRAFYILNWIVRYAFERRFDWRAVLFGIIQTALYVDFAWVYWTRQRVKLRSGGIVDSDDLSRGFLVSRVLGRVDIDTDDEERAGLNNSSGFAPTSAPRKAGTWGARGLSVSADEGVVDSRQKQNGFHDHEDALGDLAGADDIDDDAAVLDRDGHQSGHEWR